MNPYEVLGIQRDATPEAVKNAYRLRAQLDHPDKNPDKPEFVEKFQKVQLAYEVLSDPERRKKYDDTGSLDGAGEDLRSLAMQSIAGLVLQWADQEVERQGEDPVADIRKKIRELTGLHEQAKVRFEKRIAKLERKMRRFRMKTGKEGANLFISTFEHAIRDVKAELETAKRMIRCGEIALEILSDYEYDPGGIKGLVGQGLEGLLPFAGEFRK